MSVLLTDSGREITDIKEILKHQHDFYQDLFKKDDSVEFQTDVDMIPQIVKSSSDNVERTDYF